jgi:hypothetical protein
MPIYRFDIFQGEKASMRTQALDFPDNRTAWKEATYICRDLSRDVFGNLDATPKWKLEVTDDSGRALFRFRILAEEL